MQSFKEGFTKNWFLGVCIVIGSLILGVQQVGPNFAQDFQNAAAEAKQEQENQDNNASSTDNSGDNSSTDNQQSPDTQTIEGEQYTFDTNPTQT